MTADTYWANAGLTDLRQALIANSRLARPDEAARVDKIALALRPRIGQFMPDRQRYPLPQGLRRYLSIVARSFWTEAWPCCLAHRYGHGWTAWEQVPLTSGGGALRLADMPPAGPDWLPARVERTRAHHRHGLTVDYVLLLQGPPAPCPTCGKAPPRHVLRTWREYVAAQR